MCSQPSRQPSSQPSRDPSMQVGMHPHLPSPPPNLFSSSSRTHSLSSSTSSQVFRPVGNPAASHLVSQAGTTLIECVVFLLISLLFVSFVCFSALDHLFFYYLLYFSSPYSQPSRQPTKQPNSRPTCQPSKQPLSRPSCQPVGFPTHRPSHFPTAQPTSKPTGDACLNAYHACLRCPGKAVYPVCESSGQYTCFYAGGMPPVPPATPMPSIKLPKFSSDNTVLQVRQVMSGLSVATVNTTAFAAAFEQSVVAIVSPTALVIKISAILSQA